MSVASVLDDLYDALKPLAEEISGLQVTRLMDPDPTPPSLDVFPGNPFQDGAGFGVTSKQAFFTIRARVSTADFDGGQELLLRMLDPEDAASVEAAIQDVATVVADGVSGFEAYVEDTATHGRLIGCSWRVTAFL